MSKAAVLYPPDLPVGTVFTWTEQANRMWDVCRMRRWRHRRAGTHFVYRGVSESGYTFAALNTATGYEDDMMNEPFTWEMMRVIGYPSDFVDNTPSST